MFSSSNYENNLPKRRAGLAEKKPQSCQDFRAVFLSTFQIITYVDTLNALSFSGVSYF